MKQKKLTRHVAQLSVLLVLLLTGASPARVQQSSGEKPSMDSSEEFHPSNSESGARDQQSTPTQKESVSKTCRLRTREVIETGSTLPAPLAADALIRIAAKMSAQCPVVAQDLLRLAFDQASSVNLEMPFKVAITYSTDSRVAFMGDGYSLQMDRLSLQARAVLQMAAINASEAIRLFQNIPPPRPPASNCSSAFVADVSMYDKALSKILEVLRTRTPRNEAEAQLPYSLLEQAITATTSPTQLLPLAEAMRETDIDSANLSSLLNLLSARITNFPVDDRSLNSGNYWDGLVDLCDLAWKNKLPRSSLVQAYRDYLDRSVHGPHCADNLKDPASLTSTRKSMNRDLAMLAPSIAPITVPEAVPVIEFRPDTGEYWQSAKGKLLLMDAKHLNFDDQWKPFSDADRQKPEWRDRVQHMLDDIEHWYESDEQDSADYYHERCILLSRLLSQLPPGPLYDRVLMLWINTLEGSLLQWDSPAEWYYGVKEFLEPTKKGPIPLVRISALKQLSDANLHALGVLEEFLQWGQKVRNSTDPIATTIDQR